MNRSFLYIGITAVFFFWNLGCAEQERIYYSAPSLIPAVERTMKSPGFWISRHPSPDKIILNPQEIARLNENIQNELNLTQDLTKIVSPFSGLKLKTEFEQTLQNFSRRGLYVGYDIQSNLNLDAIPSEIKLRFGLIVHYADQRLFPTTKGLYAIKGDIDFDEVQNSSLDVGTPVVVLHQSRDGKWLEVISSASLGWVDIQNVAMCSSEQFKDFLNSHHFCVVIKSKTDIFLDQSLTDYYDYARMGVRFPIQNPMNENAAAIAVPLRNEDGTLRLTTGYIQTKDIHLGFLPYISRVMINQAFELLNTPYGWGGMYGEQDCSAFLQEVFSTVGIFLPRNSQAQAKVGKLLAQFDKDFPLDKKLEILSTQALGGATILPLKGHIMLFLGMSDDHAYAIHATWGYREHGWLRDRVRVLNRVVVSDLSLGEGSHKGSLLERLLAVRFIGN